MSEYRYSAEFANGARAAMTLSVAGMDVEWTPRVPKLKGKKWRQFVLAYQTWRNDCIEDFARRSGLRVAVVDL
jgi:hypothetical protein